MAVHYFECYSLSTFSLVAVWCTCPFCVRWWGADFWAIDGRKILPNQAMLKHNMRNPPDPPICVLRGESSENFATVNENILSLIELWPSSYFVSVREWIGIRRQIFWFFANDRRINHFGGCCRSPSDNMCSFIRQQPY